MKVWSMLVGRVLLACVVVWAWVYVGAEFTAIIWISPLDRSEVIPLLLCFAVIYLLAFVTVAAHWLESFLRACEQWGVK